MNERIKDLWIKALRSGKYEQGVGYLQTLDGKYCCLGVLCDIMDPNSWEVTKLGNTSCVGHRLGEDADTGRGMFIPAESIIAEAGIPAGVDCREDSYRDPLEILTDMNDGPISTFDEIADWIEENL